MRFILLFFCFAVSSFALSDNYKVVLERFDTKKAAQTSYQRYINDPLSAINSHMYAKEFVIHYRKSGEGYIIAAEPFTSKMRAEDFLHLIRKAHPNAIVSQGVADDYLFLLAQHKKNLVLQEQKTALPTITIASTLSNDHNTTTQKSDPPFPWLMVLAIILIVSGWIICREWKIHQLTIQSKDISKENDSLKKAMQAKNDFIAMMSHEIRAPINAITGITHLVLESRLTLTQRNQIMKIKDSSMILLSLINDILDQSKIEAGKITIEQIPFNLNTMLDDISNIVAHKAHEKGLELIFDIDQSVPHKLIGDPLRLLQVLINLLNNAIKFTDNGSVILRARGQHITRLHLNIQFDIIDTGIGIEKEKIQELFKPYSQADETIARKYGGSGLGLSICKNLVTLMGGTIQGKSTFGEGSTFSFNIKLHSDFDYEKRHYRLPTTELMYKNALIIDSNNESASVLQRGLEYFHYEVKIINDTNDLLAAMKYYPVDILFLDTKASLHPMVKKEIQERIKNEMLKLVWVGVDTKRQREFVLHKPYNQMTIFNIILSVYGHATNEDKVLDNTAKLKEALKRFGGKSILLAEDNEINRSIIGGLLSGTSINVLSAKNGKEAIEMVEMDPDISVILMDIQMPIMDGYEAAKIIRQEREYDSIPILAITGNTLESDIEKISQSGMNGHIAKPIDVNSFYTTLYYALEKARNRLGHL